MQPFAQIAFYPVFGFPFLLYLGAITLLSFLLTASIAVMNKKRIHAIPFKWHPRMAALSIIIAVIHGTLAMLAYI
jgi:hypothetical protein